MAEIKHTFQSGKMNKDVDDRVVPSTEYRDALNIEVRTSDDDDTGRAGGAMPLSPAVVYA